ncbi:5' nucleotidase, NT5C type [Thermoanaerobacter pentosaceus]|uniref:5' nucleotidase, deoxy (Pyrimidine), type C protein (NT5C) n=1 Tax=Thermoanaerobacter pentosaceus TaxID=694059 RepID=A0ABT9M2M8_9THEO|nr:hypothetical protein [Thermoanaerobacter pentosaceus]MDP9750388.1 hypothetical protein [Thermoanaerobacter pentosaceus]
MKQVAYFSGKVKDLPKFLNLLYNVKGKIIAFDVDNTLINVNKRLEEIGYSTVLYPNPELTEDFWTTVEGASILLGAEPIPSSLKLLTTFINLNAEVVFVTSRSRELKSLTERWAEKYFPGIEVYFTKEKYQLDADIYVEDDPHQIQKLIFLNKTVLIPKWPYNLNLFKGFENAIYYNI